MGMVTHGMTLKSKHTAGTVVYISHWISLTEIVHGAADHITALVKTIES